MTLEIDYQLQQGRYTIQGMLGQGGMGAVYLAADRNLPGRQVAIKENAEASHAAQEQFQHEAVMLARLTHTNLPRVTDHFIEPSGLQYLVMDYVEGDDLLALLRQQGGPLPESLVLAWIEQVMSALEHMHNWIDPATRRPTPIIHRDIKPSNIKRTPNDRIVLVDFGLAKYEELGEGTIAGARAFTAGYSPIEQYSGGTNIRSDIYALGATLYALVTGQKPPDAPALASGTRLPPPRQINPQLSRNTEQVILRAMRLQASERYPTITEMRAALFHRRRPTVGTNNHADYTLSTYNERPRRPAGAFWAALLLIGVLAVGIGLGAPRIWQWKNLWLPDPLSTVPTVGGGIAISTIIPTPSVTPSVIPTVTDTPTTSVQLALITSTSVLTSAAISSVVSATIRNAITDVTPLATQVAVTGTITELPPSATTTPLPATPTPVDRATPSATSTPTDLPTATPPSTATPTPPPTNTRSPTATDTPTPTPPDTPAPTATDTPRPLPTATATPSPTPTRLPTATPVPLPTVTPTFADTPTTTATATATLTATPLPTATATPLPTAVPTLRPTASNTPSTTPTPLPTATPTLTVTSTKTVMPTASATDTPTRLPSPTASATMTPVPTPTLAPTPTKATATPTPTAKPTLTPTATPTRSPTATALKAPPVAGEIRNNPLDQAAYVFVSAGEFVMGSTLERDEKPEHPVMVDSFWIGQTEVTNAQYARCVDGGVCTPPSDPAWRDADKATYPVIHITWSQAAAYAEWAGGRLATEAEWEKAARGADKRLFPWGDLITDHQRLNFQFIAGGAVAVGSYPLGASPYGALDMAGNVEEWVADWYAPDYYAQSPVSNPPGPANGLSRSVRGGSFHSNRGDVRTTRRGKAFPDAAYDSVGFRVVVPKL